MGSRKIVTQFFFHYFYVFVDLFLPNNRFERSQSAPPSSTRTYSDPFLEKKNTGFYLAAGPARPRLVAVHRNMLARAKRYRRACLTGVSSGKPGEK